MKQLNFKSISKQKGSVVMLSIIMLAVLSLLTMSAYVSNITDERGSYNIKDRTVALQSAEAALKDASNYITAKVLADENFTLTCVNSGLCLSDLDDIPLWEKLEKDKNLGWINGDNVGPSIQYGQETGTIQLESLGILKEGTSRPPRYFVEVMIQPRVESEKILQYGEQLANQYLYRVTAVGFGMNPSTRVKLQAVYLK